MIKTPAYGNRHRGASELLGNAERKSARSVTSTPERGYDDKAGFSGERRFGQDYGFTVTGVAISRLPALTVT